MDARTIGTVTHMISDVARAGGQAVGRSVVVARAYGGQVAVTDAGTHFAAALREAIWGTRNLFNGTGRTITGDVFGGVELLTRAGGQAGRSTSALVKGLRDLLDAAQATRGVIT